VCELLLTSLPNHEHPTESPLFWGISLKAYCSTDRGVVTGEA
jgi:hypothetical protein